MDFLGQKENIRIFHGDFFSSFFLQVSKGQKFIKKFLYELLKYEL